jgi:putative acetyltransferase
MWKMQLSDINTRRIIPADDTELAKIIRQTLTEFGVDRPGTVYYDETTDHLSDLFTISGSVYYVAAMNGKLLGGAGIYPTEGLPEHTCELVKMYLVPEARGMGLGTILINKSIEFARSAGYKQIYLETMPELKKALHTYARFGFQYLDGPIGNSGHFGCDVWMIKKL